MHKIHTGCLTTMEKIKAKPETGVNAKPDQPVAKPVSVNTDADEIFGFFVGQGSITGDVVSPALSEGEWGELH